MVVINLTIETNNDVKDIKEITADNSSITKIKVGDKDDITINNNTIDPKDFDKLNLTGGSLVNKTKKRKRIRKKKTRVKR